MNAIAKMVLSRCCVGLSIASALLPFNPAPAAAQDTAITPVDAPVQTARQQVKLNTTGQDVVLDVPLRERTPLGQVGVRIGVDDAISISALDLEKALGRLLTLDALTGVKGLADAEGWISLSQLSGSGYQIRFDPVLLELIVELPIEARLGQTLSLGLATARDEPVQPDQSARFSAYATYRVSWDYVHQGQREGLRRPRMDLDVNGRVFRRFAFENQLGYDGELESPFVRQSSRLIFDQPEAQMRWTGGDLEPRSIAFQGQEDIAGLGLQRLYRGFAGGRTVTSSSARRLTLQRNATVDVLINGARVRTLQLGPGNYDIGDLPLTSGSNNVQLIVQDELGRREVVSFDFFSDFLLLQPGVDEFDLQAGVRAPYVFGERDYKTDEALATGFYRRGISDSLTLGGNFQLSEQVQQLGAEGVIATRYGLFKGDFAASNSDQAGGGYAARLEYRYSQLLRDLPGARRVDLSLETRSEKFASIDALDPTNQVALVALARYSQPISPRWSASAGVDYSMGRNDQPDRYGGSAFASYNLSVNTNVNLGVIYQSGQTQFSDRDEVNLRVDIVHRFGTRSTVNASLESAERRARIGYTRAPESPLDDFGVSAQLETNRDVAALDATVVYFSNRGDLELAHQTAFDTSGSEIVAQTTSLRAGGSIAFADGRLGIGRSIYDSFAILSPHSTLEGRPVLVRGRFSQQPVARSGLFGPALVPLGAYSAQFVPYDVEELPLGYDLGTGNFEFYPWLHSGFSRVVGSQFNITVVGSLLDVEGQPLTLTYGVARAEADPSAPEIEIFTNRTGRFGASGLAPGAWLIRMTNGLAYRLMIESGGESLVRLEGLTPIEIAEVRP
ncbi:fimbria/pilus outer membrane usher protein [Brevundimonas intermedia]|uniref:fimbria/pilus outer membrane usher protein n=1 Tax=Brevundimonas intermedia TaxID=74315 RepID=UPI003208A56E